MFLFVMILLVMRNKSDKPCSVGGTPEKPPDLDAETCRNYATAYYWDMYGALNATHNATLTGPLMAFDKNRSLTAPVEFVVINRPRRIDMFDSLTKLVGDVATVVTKPLEAAVDATRVVTKPLADIAKGAADTIKEVTDDITKD